MSDEYIDWVPASSPSTPPPATTLRWVEDQVGADVIAVEALDGGLSSAVHRLTLGDGRQAVLRRFTLADWLEREPHIPADEARNLSLLGSLDVGVETPQLVAADVDGSVCDVPAIVMSHVPGRPEIDPVDAEQWVDKLADCLARLHEQPAIDGLPDYHPWNDPNRPLPTWTSQPDLWSEAIERGRAPLPHHAEIFLHRDYHPNNIHWLDGEICGIVDWLSACNGPAAGDLSHCRWNLAVLGEPTLADRFLDRYRSVTGYSEDTWAFDLATVLSGPVGPFPTHAWNALGRTDLTSDIVAARIDRWLEQLMTAR